MASGSPCGKLGGNGSFIENGLLEENTRILENERAG
jgi:hypothetical protein